MVGKQVVQQNRDTNSNLIKNNPSNEMVASQISYPSKNMGVVGNIQ